MGLIKDAIHDNWGTAIHFYEHARDGSREEGAGGA